MTPKRDITEADKQRAKEMVVEWKEKVATGQTAEPMEEGKADFPPGLRTEGSHGKPHYTS
ncbi:hypothetical protein CEN49_27770 [Fischerella thermalis CCMEE 5273]|nr:hypothetical protein CEN49_27770 [Fischerella thermalis CCMEE 5273]